ncbi:proton-coupled amino acid transporter-like protein CG1139 [Adelges cooleyi]|uniref:proton-coupled amino acid transporter-like protein CG1139 n=1 Tax=Adelges cooleyi TaxID=133065 RepID=UPI0021805EA3|nr:proton-coupled amino acid transporter-like protein CG1139 [Adelges cooleyi]
MDQTLPDTCNQKPGQTNADTSNGLPRSKGRPSITSLASSLVVNDQLKISNLEAAVHIVKSTIGGGFLSMPDAFKHAGLLVGSLGTFVMGLAVYNTLSIIVKCSQAIPTTREPGDPSGIPRKLDFPETVEYVFLHGARGKFAKWASLSRRFTGTTLFVTYYGVNVIYVCIIATTAKQFVDNYFPYGILRDHSIRWYPSLVALVVIPLGMVRLMKYLVPFSAIANMFMGIGSGMVFYYLAIGDQTSSDTRDVSSEIGNVTSASSSAADQVQWIAAPLSQWPLFMGTCLCSMEGVGMLLHIESAMKNPRALLEKPWYTLLKSMAIIVLLNSSMGFFGYLRYGNQVAGSISLSLPQDSWLSQSVKLAIALGILFTYGLQLTVTAELLWRSIQKSYFGVDLYTGDEQHKSEGKKSSDGAETVVYYTMRLFLILSTILMATVIPDIGPLVSLVGSIGFSVLGLTVPVCMETVWLYYEGEDQGPESSSVRRVLRHGKNVFLFALSVIAAVTGAYFSIRDIVDNYHASSSGTA